jgi:type VI secretion system protein ImpC
MVKELDAWFDQFSLSFHSSREDKDVVLPLRILVLADFGVGQQPANPRPITISAVGVRNFDEVMAAQNITLTLDRHQLAVNHPTVGRLVTEPLLVTLRSLHSFHPDDLLANEPLLVRIRGLILRLRSAAGEAGVNAEVVLPTLSAQELRWLALEKIEGDAHWAEGLVTATGKAVSRAWLDFLITDLEADLNQVLNCLLHHPDVQRVEAAWRSLHWLVLQAASDTASQVDFASVPRERLQHDLVYSADLEESEFFELLYSQEYGQYGGRPYGAVIADYRFGYGAEDVEMLSRLGEICRMAHCPFISSVAAEFFGVKSFAALSGLTSLQEMLEGRQYLKWRAFQQTEAAAYIVLTLPHILLRDAWRCEPGGVSETLAVETLNAAGDSSLWGNAAFAMGGCLLRSFRRFRMCTHLTGADGGLVEGLPETINRETGERVYPLEVLVSENREADLISMGLAPLSVAKASHSVLFHAANSVRWGCFQRRLGSHSVPLGTRLGAQLPYLFIILRIAHYLRMIYRENLGSSRSLADLKGELVSWLKSYVSDVESPAPAVRARRPLRKALLVEAGSVDSADWHTFKLVLTPHIRYGGDEYELAVNMGMSQGDDGKV